MKPGALNKLSRLLLAGVAALALGSWEGEATAGDLCPPIQLTSPTGLPFQKFGSGTAIVGDAAFIGTEPFLPGSVHVFKRLGSAWIHQQQIFASDGGGEQGFGRMIAVNGDMMLVGANGHVHPGAPGSGSVYAFRQVGSQWREFQELFAPDGAISDNFGVSVALGGDVAIVGAPLHDLPSFGAGAAYVYRFDVRSSQWVFAQKLTASDALAGDQFGEDVALLGSVALIGAVGVEGPVSTGAGAVYCFQHNGSRWIETQKLMATNIGPCPACFDDRFGASIAMSPDYRGGLTAVIGAPGDVGAVGLQGSAYFFRFDARTGLWSQEQDEVTAPGADSFGSAVAIDGDWAVIGAYNTSIISPQYGAAYAYHFDGSRWTLVHSFFPAPGIGPLFGRSVAVSGTTALVGAPMAGGATFSGAAFVHALEEVFADLSCDGHVSGFDLAMLLAAWGPAKARPNTDASADLNGDGVVNGLDLELLLGAWG